MPLPAELNFLIYYPPGLANTQKAMNIFKKANTEEDLRKLVEKEGWFVEKTRGFRPGGKPNYQKHKKGKK